MVHLRNGKSVENNKTIIYNTDYFDVEEMEVVLINENEKYLMVELESLEQENRYVVVGHGKTNTDTLVMRDEFGIEIDLLTYEKAMKMLSKTKHK